ncbi:MAG: hypothetical protein ABEJ79_00365 [Halolamina sp.]
MFDDASDNAIAAAHGKDVSAEESDPIAPMDCPRCGRETPREEDFCVWCDQALDRGAVETMKEREQMLRESVLRLIREDPGLVDARLTRGAVDPRLTPDELAVPIGAPEPRRQLLADSHIVRQHPRAPPGNADPSPDHPPVMRLGL